MRSDRQEVSDSLHLNRLDSWLEQHACTPYGRELLERVKRVEGLELERRFEAAQAWSKALEREHPPILSLDDDCRPALSHLQRKGELDGMQLNSIRALLQVLSDLRRLESASAASISGLTSALGEYEDALQRLHASIAANGELLDSASAELGPLRHRRDAARRRHTQLADSLRDELHTEGHLSDRYVTQREDRHVLPIKAASKRQFGGVIHDASRSGKTAFVEPASLLEAGAAVRHAEEAVTAEEKRILKRLSQIIAEHAGELSDDLKVLATLDSDRARGCFSRRFNGVIPTFQRQRIRLKALKPPALLLADVTPVVPVDLELEDPARILIISGPNGGGKSVALSACAWAFELAHQGIPIPAQEVTLPAPPYSLCAVIGDAADDRQAHSTFSGHLGALQGALEHHQNPSSLIVIDEIASGTEPMAGSAIACGFLETFAEGEAFVVATTHYDPVKQLGLSDERMRTAAVRDRRNPEVAFRLFADEVGGSHPIKLAIDLGLPEQVIERARKHLDPNRRARLDELKRQQTEEANLEQIRRRLDLQERTLAERQAELDNELQKLERSREKQRVQNAKAKAKIDTLRSERLAQIDALREELSETVKKLRADQGSQAAKDGDRLFADVKALRNEAQALSLDDESPTLDDSIEVGDSVRLFSGGNVGVVQEFRGRSAVVLVDGKMFHLRKEQLQRVQNPAPNKAKGGASKSTKSKKEKTIAVTESSAPKLDLRGLRAHEAEARIDRFLQHLCDVDCAGRIIHGIGTGALRKTTLDYLKNGPWRVTYRQGLSSEGSDGVTVVTVES